MADRELDRLREQGRSARARLGELKSERAALREAHGARPGEPFIDFVGRLVFERECATKRSEACSRALRRIAWLCGRATVALDPEQVVNAVAAALGKEVPGA